MFWLERLDSTGDGARDDRLARSFFARMGRYGFGGRSAILLYEAPSDDTLLSAAKTYGANEQRIRGLARDADLLWNFCGVLRQPLLSLFKCRALVDLDPGLWQICALTWDMGLSDHDAFLTVGTNLHEADSQVPLLGRTWHRFTPFVHLPMWPVGADPGDHAPFSSVTEWTWHTIGLGERLLSCSKRDAYLRFRDLPQRAARPFELAANINPDDTTGDRELLLEHGWKLAHPHDVASSPSAYRRYIRRSRAEIACAKPVYRELRTGWFSDRSACYLASGRPVLAEDTGISKHLPTGEGLLVFRDIEDAAEGVAAIDTSYRRHMRAARDLAEAYLDARRCQDAMLAASFQATV